MTPDTVPNSPSAALLAVLVVFYLIGVGAAVAAGILRVEAEVRADEGAWGQISCWAPLLTFLTLSFTALLFVGGLPSALLWSGLGYLLGQVGRARATGLWWIAPLGAARAGERMESRARGDSTRHSRGEPPAF